jgi:hypothetical protein
MAQIMTDQPRLEAAARSVAAKLQAFHEGLTPDEQMALDLALRQFGTEADGSEEDVSGHTWKLTATSTAGCRAQADQIWYLTNLLSLGFITEITYTCEVKPA